MEISNVEKRCLGREWVELQVVHAAYRRNSDLVGQNAAEAALIRDEKSSGKSE
jgi:hypothetical protein